MEWFTVANKYMLALQPRSPFYAALELLVNLEWNRRRQWHPTPVLLPGKSHGWRSRAGCSPWGRWGSDTTERLYTFVHWRRQWHPTPVLLPGKSHGWRRLVGCSPWGRWGSDTTERLHFDFHFRALEKEMATHSSVLAWRIPGTGEPGGLPSMGSQSQT